MTQRPNTEATGTSTPPVEGDAALLVAEVTPVPDLPGLLKKKVVIGSDESGLVTSNGNVVSELASGSNEVGLSFLGWGAGSRDVLRVRSRPFGLQLQFSNLLSKGYDNLDAFVHLTVSVSSSSIFNTMVLGDRDRVYSSQLASNVAAALDDLFQVKVAQSDAKALRDDQDSRDQFTEELRPHLSRVLEERGLLLESVDLVAFHNRQEGHELLDELTHCSTSYTSVDPRLDDSVRAGLEARGHRLLVIGEGFAPTGFASFASPVAIVRVGPGELTAGVDTFHSAYAAGL